tara:strand:+ start:1334 stop:1441 length:108 start_codon:yes stop_codon:yes gene_type:complete
MYDYYEAIKQILITENLSYNNYELAIKELAIILNL